MPPQNVLFSHRAFALAVKRIDLSTGQPDWLVSGEPYRLDWTLQRIKIELLNGDPYIELDWTNVNAGEFPVTVTIRARLEDCCKSIKVKHHLLNQAWIAKEDSAVKFWSEGLEIAFPHHTDKKNFTYNCMTLSLGGVDFGKAQWTGGLVARLGKEDREFVQGLKTKTRDIEIVTCWSREIEGDWSYLTPFEERCAAINRTLQQRAAPPAPQQNGATALPAPTQQASAPPSRPQRDGPSRTRPRRMPFFPGGKLAPLGWGRHKKLVEEETEEQESAPVSDEAEAKAKAELQERQSREASKSGDDRERSPSIEEIENPSKNRKRSLSIEEVENPSKKSKIDEREAMRLKTLESFAAVRAKLDVGDDTDLETLLSISAEVRSMMEDASSH